MLVEVKKKRGRPSKSSTPNEQINGIIKPQVQSAPVLNHQEQENTDEPAKKKRGRPSGSSPKKTVVAAVSSAAAAVSKDASPTRKRGRPSGSAGVKKSISKPKATVNTNGSARKRGRPKKSVASPTETSVATTPTNVQ